VEAEIHRRTDQRRPVLTACRELRHPDSQHMTSRTLQLFELLLALVEDAPEKPRM
jgi:hypothetical protein